ncbi:hypothetical protein [Virgibacillus sediminis]|uniref:Uncharacterized protein n=1 Tax=Virgibacillus sediminis TaxID=202260 RepID=A0ABV7A944_9BACI
MGALVSLIFYVFTLYILYLVVAAAVMKGINESRIGEYFANKSDIEDKDRT